MCGICGFYGFEDREVLKRMVNILSHRGPDDNGFYTDENISLGHTRLSIIDLSERGRQPMSNEDGTIWITYNGETYNFMDLRNDLEKKHDFYSNTDTEVLIHAYEEYGLDFIKKLRGMFAFALYDSENKKLILARDPIGKKPLYYYWDGNDFIFASEIKAILETGIKKEINLDGLCAYLAYQYTIGRNTMFKGIKKGFDERDNLVGYIGRLSEEKGTLNFVKAIPEILKERNEIRFLIGGNGQLRDKIEEYLDVASLNDKVKLAGWIPHDELPDYLNELKLVVLPSYTEGLPNIMLEAMACGTPVLATPVGAIPDVIKDGETGFIMENNSPACIAENVERALNHPNLEEIVKTARKLVEKEFTYEAAVERYRKILENI